MTQEAIQEQIRQALDHRVAVRVYDENRDISRQDMELLMAQPVFSWSGRLALFGARSGPNSSYPA